MPSYRVKLNAIGILRGSICVEAESEKDAQDAVFDVIGDIVWNYEGADDPEVESVEKVE